jgi:hypothetical protein
LKLGWNAKQETCLGRSGIGTEKVASQAEPSAAKACVDFAALTAQQKPRPFKTKSKPEFFRKL